MSSEKPAPREKDPNDEYYPSLKNSIKRGFLHENGKAKSVSELEDEGNLLSELRKYVKRLIMENEYTRYCMQQYQKQQQQNRESSSKPNSKDPNRNPSSVSPEKSKSTSKIRELTPHHDDGQIHGSSPGIITHEKASNQVIVSASKTNEQRIYEFSEAFTLACISKENSLIIPCLINVSNCCQWPVNSISNSSTNLNHNNHLPAGLSQSTQALKEIIYYLIQFLEAPSRNTLCSAIYEGWEMQLQDKENSVLFVWHELLVRTEGVGVIGRLLFRRTGSGTTSSSDGGGNRKSSSTVKSGRPSTGPRPGNYYDNLERILDGNASNTNKDIMMGH